MANLTLALDDALLQRAREAALRENTSVNAMVRDFLSRYVEGRSRRLEALSRFEAVAALIRQDRDGGLTRRLSD